MVIDWIHEKLFGCHHDWRYIEDIRDNYVSWKGVIQNYGAIYRCLKCGVMKNQSASCAFLRHKVEQHG